MLQHRDISSTFWEVTCLGAEGVACKNVRRVMQGSCFHPSSFLQGSQVGWSHIAASQEGEAGHRTS